MLHCPYCDGWEWRDQALGVYGGDRNAVGLALELIGWSQDIIVCSNGPAELGETERALLSRNGIGLREERIAALEGDGERLERIRFEGGDSLARQALFFCSSSHQASALAVKLGCELNAKGAIATGSYEKTNIPGLFVAGDASRFVRLAIVAAAEGAMAAFAINSELLHEQLER